MALGKKESTSTAINELDCIYEVTNRNFLYTFFLTLNKSFIDE